MQSGFQEHFNRPSISGLKIPLAIPSIPPSALAAVETVNSHSMS